VTIARPSAVVLIVVASAAAGAAAAAVAAQTQVQRSTVWSWAPQEAKPNAWGAVRQVTRTPTPTLDALAIHISALPAGKSPHAPHQHEHEELLIVKEGTLETSQNGVTRRAPEGSIIFQSSNELHNVTNVGQTPATYYVVAWKSAGPSK